MARSKKQVVEATVKRPFPTSDAMINRILWDDQFDAFQYEIGYEDRFVGRMYMPLPHFRGGLTDEFSEIPMHRVYEIRTVDGTVVWDREKRICTLGVDDEAPPASAPGTAGSTASRAAAMARVSFTVVEDSDVRLLTAAAYDDATDAWVPHTFTHETETGPVRTSISVVTYNVLFASHRPEEFHPPQRTKLLLQELERVDADVVALQEVEPPTRRLILSSAFIRRTYKVVDSEGKSADPSGQLVLTKFPILCCWQVAFGPLKRAILCKCSVPTKAGPLEVVVCDVHLTSDHSKNNESTRLEQLAKVYSHLAKAPAVVLCGDFNFGDDGPEQQRLSPGYRDCWPMRHSGQSVEAEGSNEGDECSGFSYDLERNWMAEATCQSHRYPRRLDRVFVRVPWATCTACELCGNKAYHTRVMIGGGRYTEREFFPSDHFGVVATLRIEAEKVTDNECCVDAIATTSNDGHDCAVSSSDVNEVAAPSSSSSSCVEPVPMSMPTRQRIVHTSTVCVIPELHVWDPIQRIRAVHDPVFLRWPPHINLLYPFFTHDAFDTAAAAVANAARRLRPFTVHLSHYTSFQRGRHVLLAPDESEGHHELCAVYAELIKAFPMCKVRDDFAPHLTVAQVAPKEKEKFVRTLQCEGVSLRFRVSELHMMSRTGDEPFRVFHSVPLGTDAPLPTYPTPSVSLPLLHPTDE